MISINVKHFTKSDSNYLVTLGNGTKFKFSNEKQCLKFLCKTSKFLTKTYNELNLYFAQVFTLYRQNYFYFDNNRRKRHAELYANRRRINANIYALEHTFEQLSFIHLSANANLTAFYQLQLISDLMLEIVIICKSLNSSKSYVAMEIQSDLLIESIIKLKNSLTQYSITDAIAFEVPDLNQSKLLGDNPLMKVV